MLKCPECYSTKLWKNGKRWVGKKRLSPNAPKKRILIQQYKCKNCGRITYKPKGLPTP